MSREFRILITGAGTSTAVTALKGLRAAGDPSIRVVMGDIRRECAGAYLGDEFAEMPLASAPDFSDRVTKICRERKIDLVIPIIDYEFVHWSRLSAELMQSGTRVVISPEPALTVAEEKDKTFEYFQSLRVPTIDTWRADEIADPAKLPFPVYLKPRCGRASLDNYIARNTEEYRLSIAKVPDPIVQPLTSGEEVTIDTISDFEGRFLAACPRIRLEVKSGQAYRSVTIDRPDLVAMARRIVEGLPIVGPSNIQCFLTDAGPAVFEINARFGAASILSIQAGMNGPAALVAMARGEALPPLAPRPGVLMLRYWQEVFA
jgi:carbamoyl-phosphate synthase large subunit